MPSTPYGGEWEDVFIETLTSLLRDMDRAENAARSAATRLEGAAGEAALEIEAAVLAIESAIERADSNMIAVFPAAFSLLPAASLVFLNFTLGSRKSMQLGLFAAFVHFCRSVVRWFYRDVGGKLKILAKIQGVICIVLACLSALVASYGLIGFLTGWFFTGLGFDYLSLFVMSIGGIVSSFILALPTLLLYAFGSMTKDLREIKENGISSGSVVAGQENPDELPEI